jgi:flagellar biosynthesis protein FliR
VVWLLFMLRTLGFIAVAPFFSARNAPVQFRIFLVFLMTSISFAAWSPLAVSPGSAPARFFPAAVNELLLGLILGFLVGLIFVTFQFAGQFIGYQMGFAIVNVLDPQSQEQVSIIGQFLFAVATLVFFGLNLHHDLLGVWHVSYEMAPPGHWSFAGLARSTMLGAQEVPVWLPWLGAVCGQMMWLALKIALPLLAFLMLTDLALGIIARVMPQLNVFIVGIPLKIAMGLFFLSILLLQFDPIVREATNRFVDHAGQFLHMLK